MEVDDENTHIGLDPSHVQLGECKPIDLKGLHGT